MKTTNDEFKGSKSPPKHCKILIVGGGISGICLAAQLNRHKLSDFIVLEKSEDIGGTWNDNTYPGCGCDIPSLLYSFSFAVKNAWTRKYAPQPEILKYFNDCVDRFSIRDKFYFGHSVTKANWNEDDKRWEVFTASGDIIRCDYFVSAVGQLSRPAIPKIDGAQNFEGQVFHSARWPESFDPKNRTIGVIGNGASAIQIVPEIAKTAQRVKIFQRSPNWILPRHDHRYGLFWRLFNRYIPFAARVQRLFMYLTFELRILFYNRRTFLNKMFTGWSRMRMKKRVPTALRKDVIPSFPAGCKRVLLSNNYLESLHRPNVELITDNIETIISVGVQTSNSKHTVDTLVMATGFEANRFLYPIEIHGVDNRSITEVWKKRPQSYYGMLVPGFPNFCMLYGPNTNLGHNSIIFMVECQVQYLIRLIRTTEKQGYDCFEVEARAMKEFDLQLQQQLDKKVWNGYAKNWYTNEGGYITNNWCRSTLAYMWQTRRVKKSALRFSSRTCTQVANTTPTVC